MWTVLFMCAIQVYVSQGEHAQTTNEEVEPPTVSLDGLGVVQGMPGISRGGDHYLQFRGIPYAAPPLGQLRFLPPVPVSPWKGILDATTVPPVCIQNPYLYEGSIVGSEDCLYLNIYTRSLTPSVLRPVYVFIHGGAFVFGGAAGYTGEYVMEQDWVVVTLQYRLGPMGFLSTEDSTLPGNMGLQDQLLSLHWIQEHIHKFGGDKGLVTLSGMSAGGASVHYLLLSPHSHGLFHRALSMSGTSLCWWSSLSSHTSTAHSLASRLQCPTQPSTALRDCLREKDAKEIMEAQGALYTWHLGTPEREPMNIWSPRSDPEGGSAAVLPTHPIDVMESRDIKSVPFLVGVAETEGGWRGNNLLGVEQVREQFLNEMDSVLPLVLGLHSQVPGEDMEAVLESVKKYYVGGITGKEKWNTTRDMVATGLVLAMGDSMFNYAIDRTVRLHGASNVSPTWMYVYNVTHSHSLTFMDPANPGSRKIPELSVLHRTTHAQEVGMTFPVFEAMMGPLSSEEITHSRNFINFLYNFALHGDPRMEGQESMSGWEPVTEDNLSHLVFGQEATEVRHGLPFEERMSWWNSVMGSWRNNSRNEDRTRMADTKLEF